MIFQWQPWNVAHLRKHDVTPAEAKHVVLLARPPYPQEIGDDKIVVWGQTAEGRYLQVIYVELAEEEVDVVLLDLVERLAFDEGEEVVWVIHARDLEPDEKRQLWRRRR